MPIDRNTNALTLVPESCADTTFCLTAAFRLLAWKKNNDNNNDNDNRVARGRHTRGDEAPARVPSENLLYFFYESALTSCWLRSSCRVGR